MTKHMVTVLGGLFSGLFFLASCLPTAPAQPVDADMAAFDAQVTLTAHALRAQGTAQVEQTRAAATQAASATAYIQTQIALDEQYRQATYQAELAGSTATQQAIGTTTAIANAVATETAEAGHTATARVEAQSATGTAMAEAQATATVQIQATQQAEAARTARNERWVAGLWRVFWGLVVMGLVGLLIWGGIKIFPVFRNYLEAKELQARTIRNDRGEVDTIIIDADRNLRTMQPRRAAGHGLGNTVTGIEVYRTPDGAEWQERTTQRAQLADLMEAAMRHQNNQRQLARRLVREATGHGANPQLPSGMGEDVVEAEVVMLSPDAPEVYEILTDVEDKFARGDYQ